VAAGTATLKDATSEAIRDWVTNVETTHYILGSAAGPHPYPMMVRASAQPVYRLCVSWIVESETAPQPGVESCSRKMLTHLMLADAAIFTPTLCPASAETK
jgi:hypothetical protein